MAVKKKAGKEAKKKVAKTAARKIAKKVVKKATVRSGATKALPAKKAATAAKKSAAKKVVANKVAKKAKTMAATVGAKPTAAKATATKREAEAAGGAAIRPIHASSEKFNRSERAERSITHTPEASQQAAIAEPLPVDHKRSSESRPNETERHGHVVDRLHSDAAPLASAGHPPSHGQPHQTGEGRRRRRRRRRRGRNRDGMPHDGQGAQGRPGEIHAQAHPHSHGRAQGHAHAHAHALSAVAQPADERELSPIERVARDRFGIHRLLPEQIEAMNHVLAGRDTMAVLPTGFGKSLIYQVPAMIIQRPTVVISPLIALMRDQERGLRERHVPVIRLDSTLSAETRRQNLARLRKGGRLIVLTTPETLQAKDTRPVFAEAKPGLLCVDEAHCISEWGHDFRPAYLRLGHEREALAIPTVLALTATATPHVREDIAQKLHMKDVALILSPPQRPNLRLSVHQVEGNTKIERAGQLLRKMPRPAIIYCATTKAVDEVFGALSRAQIPCARYHGGMSTDERTTSQRRFMKDGKHLVMIATSAFGMGIDKEDIRAIMHFQAPGSLEQYVQESGRAGRDGLRSECTLLFDPADLQIHDFLNRTSRPNFSQLTRVGEALAAWAEDGKSVNVKDLALSAGIPTSTCGALVGQLEDIGAVALDGERRYVLLVTPDELRSAAKDLAGRFDRQKMEDDRRMKGIADYAQTPDCRSIFIRKWFGEDDPPKCGNCDRCARGEPSSWAAGGGASALKPVKQGRRRRNRRRRR